MSCNPLLLSFLLLIPFYTPLIFYPNFISYPLQWRLLWMLLSLSLLQNLLLFQLLAVPLLLIGSGLVRYCFNSSHYRIMIESLACCLVKFGTSFGRSMSWVSSGILMGSWLGLSLVLLLLCCEGCFLLQKQQCSDKQKSCFGKSWGHNRYSSCCEESRERVKEERGRCDHQQVQTKRALHWQSPSQHQDHSWWCPWRDLAHGFQPSRFFLHLLSLSF